MWPKTLSTGFVWPARLLRTFYIKDPVLEKGCAKYNDVAFCNMEPMGPFLIKWRHLKQERKDCALLFFGNFDYLFAIDNKSVGIFFSKADHLT